MPTSLASACRHPGCPAVVQAGYCAKHQRLRDLTRAMANQQYDSTHRRWRVLILNRDPICRMCKTAPATVADHIIPLRKGGDWSLANGQGLCWSCHQRKRASTDKER